MVWIGIRVKIVRVKARVRETIMTNTTQTPNLNPYLKNRQIRQLQTAAARNVDREEIKRSDRVRASVELPL